jgi:hypothetical protein
MSLKVFVLNLGNPMQKFPWLIQIIGNLDLKISWSYRDLFPILVWKNLDEAKTKLFRLVQINRNYLFLYIFFCRLECVGHSYSLCRPFILLRDVWIRTQRVAMESRRTTNLATHLSYSKVTYSM